MDPTEKDYSSGTLLTVKGDGVTNSGTCGYLFYILNNNTNNGQYTVDVYRNDSHGLVTSLFGSLLVVFMGLFWNSKLKIIS